MKQLFRSLLVALVTIGLVISASSSAFAQSQIKPISNYAIPEQFADNETAVSGQAFTQFVVFAFQAMTAVGGLLVLVYLIQAAFEWITAEGKDAKIASARQKMTGAVAGLIVLVGLFAIIQFVESFFDVNILRTTIPTLADPEYQNQSP